jgi:hypothetical protein
MFADSRLYGLFGVFLSAAAFGQDIEWQSVDAGAAELSSGPYTLSATIGQPDASGPVSAGDLTLNGGYWPVTTLADLEVAANALTTPVLAGTAAAFAVEVRNRGAATTPVTLAIDLPPELGPATTSGCAEDPAGVPTCTLPMMSPGQTIGVAVEASAAGVLPPTLASEFAVAGQAFESDPDDNVALLATPTGADSGLGLSVGAAPDPVIAGETLDYTLTIANGGPSDDPAAALVSQFDPALSCGWTSVAEGGADGNTDASAPAELDETLDLPAGGSVTYSIECAVDPARRSALATRFDATGSVDSTDQAEVETTTGVVASADVAVALTASDSLPGAGQLVDYEVRVDNAGPSSAFAVELATTLGEGLDFDSADSGCTFDGNDSVVCSLGDLPPGAEVVRTITALNDASRGPREVRSEVIAATPDPDADNNSAILSGFSAVPIPVTTLPGQLILIMTVLLFGWLALRRVAA